MPRKQRVDFPGAWHHVMNRGRRREAVFVDDDGCQLFLDVIGAVFEHNGCEVHGYSLMPNHFHLLVRSARGDLSALNRLHGWDGAVFRGRFKSQLVTDEAYLGHLLAYLHLNPVRAHLVSRPDEPSWTSHRPYLGLDRPPPLVEHGDAARAARRARGSRGVRARAPLRNTPMARRAGHRARLAGGARHATAPTTGRPRDDADEPGRRGGGSRVRSDGGNPRRTSSRGAGSASQPRATLRRVGPPSVDVHVAVGDRPASRHVREPGGESPEQDAPRPVCGARRLAGCVDSTRTAGLVRDASGAPPPWGE